MEKNSHPMNDIYSRQNEEQFLGLLRAFRCVYKFAKRLGVFLFVASALIPLAINVSFLLFDNPTVKSILCLIALSMVLIAFVLKEVIDYYKEIGALIQQQYDLLLFGIGDISTSDKSRIEKYVIKYGKNSFDKELNWYEDYSKLKDDLNILCCQKENISWTSRLIDRYLLFVTVMVIVAFVPIIIDLIVFNSDINSILQLFYNTIPILTFSFYIIYKSINERIRIARIKDYINFIFENVKKKRNIHEELKVLQNMIFDFRKSKRAIPDWLYNLFYKKDSLYEEIVSKNE